MFHCVCGKEFKHGSSLSRHQRGSEKQNILPCKDFVVKSTKGVDVELANHILKTLTSLLEKEEAKQQSALEAEKRNYQHGKVYRIVDDRGQVYIGSTVNSLVTRLAGHKKDFRKWQEGKKEYCTSYEVLKSGINGIFLLEEYPCESKQQLLEREKYYIQQTPNCVNKVLPIK